MWKVLLMCLVTLRMTVAWNSVLMNRGFLGIRWHYLSVVLGPFESLVTRFTSSSCLVGCGAGSVIRVLQPVWTNLWLVVVIVQVVRVVSILLLGWTLVSACVVLVALLS